MRILIQALHEDLSDADRSSLPASDFVFPDRRGWPIPDEEHGRIALRFIKQKRGESSDWNEVKATVLQRFPDLKDYAKELGI